MFRRNRSKALATVALKSIGANLVAVSVMMFGIRDDLRLAVVASVDA